MLKCDVCHSFRVGPAINFFDIIEYWIPNGSRQLKIEAMNGLNGYVRRIDDTTEKYEHK